MRWPCKHRWEVLPPIGIGPTYRIGTCQCLKCGALRERYLNGREIQAW